MVAIACTDKQGHVALVLKRTKTRTTYIATSKKKRKLIKTDNRLCTYDFQIICNNPVTVAEKWLAAPINMTQEVRKRLEMIIAMKKNSVVAKCENLSEVPEGTDVFTSAEDMQGRSLRSLNALYAKVSGDAETKFENAEAASIAVWDAFESFEVPTKEKKVKEPKEKKAPRELIELPKHIGKRSVITVNVENPKRQGSAGYAAFEKYVNGMTVGDYIAQEGCSMLDVRWDAQRGLTTIDFIDDEPKEKPTKEPKKKKSEDAE